MDYICLCIKNCELPLFVAFPIVMCDKKNLELKRGDPKHEASAYKFNKNEKNSIDKENIVRKILGLDQRGYDYAHREGVIK